MEGEKTSKPFWQRPLLINPCYFALLFLGMCIMTFEHIVSMEKGWTLSPIYFLSNALIQSFLEALVLVFIGSAIKTYFHRGVYYFFISLCFLFFILHYIDFILVRFMDISIYYGLYWVFSESFDNFIELLHLTGIKITTWSWFLAAAALMIPLSAIFLYKLTAKLTLEKRVRINHKRLIQTFFCAFIGLIAMDIIVAPKIEYQTYHYYQKALPWKSTLFSPNKSTIQIEKSLKTLPNENQVLKKVHSVPFNLTKKPNIYLFIVESLREDFLNEKTAKHITSFKKENIFFKKTFSSANATQISWYSIFHSNYPLHWEEAKKKWKSGSIPLQILKKMGYKIHLYSAAQLNYYGLSDVIFGKNHYLADSYHVYPHYFPTQASESDLKTINAFTQDLNQNEAKEGNVYLFFLESTHFNYNWPENYPLHFKPISEEKTHLRISNSLKNIELIKNRYRNSIHFVDSLFGKVVETLKDQGLYRDSVLIFTGDHGEEFFEEGQLFHASHLSPMQIEPPIYMKLGNNQRASEKDVQKHVISHIDIFPTVIDYLIDNQPFKIFDGQSIFDEKRKNYVISARFNGPRAPDEILISDGEQKGIFKLSGTKALHILSVKGQEKEALEKKPFIIKEKFNAAITELFNGR